MPIKPADPQAIVIFGASGDLTRRKLLPAFFHLFVEGLLPPRFAIVGYGRSDKSDGQFREEAREDIGAFARCDPSPEEWAEFARHLSYCSGDYETEGAMSPLRDHLELLDRTEGTEGRRFFYAATPPVAYPAIVKRIEEAGMQASAKIVIEKPFGYDLHTSRQLGVQLHEVFDESQIFRIDHYLGKETVQNILAFRFTNGMFEPIWNRRYVDNVQITVAEDIGIERRGPFFEQTGTIRDMVQTHLFQTLTFVAMEPPVSFDPDRLRDEKVRVLRSMKPVQPSAVVRGQFVGYRNEEGVASNSQSETYAAMRIDIDNWRWAGVPFFIRTGKRLRRKVSEISLAFRYVPYNVLEGVEAEPPGRDALTFRVQPHEGISIHLNIKRPGPGLELQRAELDFDYEREMDVPLLEAYELLIVEAMGGDHALFTRQDEVERAWEVLAPVLEHPSPVEFYEPGSWGPREADALLLPRHWHVTARKDEE